MVVDDSNQENGSLLAVARETACELCRETGVERGFDSAGLRLSVGIPRWLWAVSRSGISRNISTIEHVERDSFLQYVPQKPDRFGQGSSRQVWTNHVVVARFWIENRLDMFKMAVGAYQLSRDAYQLHSTARLS